MVLGIRRGTMLRRWPVRPVTRNTQRQITGKNSSRRRSNWARQPGTIRQWFHRAIRIAGGSAHGILSGSRRNKRLAPEAMAAIAKPSIAETWRKKHPVSS